jgi:diketogulonate reductase-like aldo/keto reductase
MADEDVWSRFFAPTDALMRLGFQVNTNVWPRDHTPGNARRSASKCRQRLRLGRSRLLLPNSPVESYSCSRTSRTDFDLSAQEQETVCRLITLLRSSRC